MQGGGGMEVVPLGPTFLDQSGQCHVGVSHVERYLSHRFIRNYINGQRNSKTNVVFRMSNFHQEALAF